MNQSEEIARLRAALEPFSKYQEDWLSSARSPDSLLVFGREGQGLTFGDFREARAALAIQPADPTGPGPEWWDDNSVQCGNCGVQIVTLGGSTYLKHGDIKRPNMGLSDVGDSEDEALCGLCAGAQMYIYIDELEVLREKPAAPSPAVQDAADALAEAVYEFTECTGSFIVMKRCLAAYRTAKAQAGKTE